MAKPATSRAALFTPHPIEVAPIAAPTKLVILVAVDVAVCRTLDVVIKVANVGGTLSFHSLPFTVLRGLLSAMEQCNHRYV